MSFTYERLPDPGSGLRLHLNENTAGPSPRVLEAIRRLGATDFSFYPDYTRVHRTCAAAAGLTEDRLVLTNGLDEGIFAACVAWLQTDRGEGVPETIVPEPAFDMYAATADACGGRVRFVPPGPDLALPLDAVLAAITDRTRLVFLTTPANPSGLLVPHEAIHAIARALPAGALLFVDEAYVDFADPRSSVLSRIDEWPNVVVGRTFAKAYGMAALRAGYVAGQPGVIDRFRRVVPPYSLNIAAVAGLEAALSDPDYTAWYVSQVRESRALVYETCRKLALPFWKSEANFVLVRVGPDATAIVEALASRGIFVRDRSRQPGCDGCIRITAGVVEHTRACLAALEEVLCGAR